jgi:hypothetical protein
MSLATDVPGYKFVVVLNKKLDPGVVLNATAHLVAALMATAGNTDKGNMKFLEYHDADGQVHPVSGLSLIVLRADNSNKIRAARQRAIDSNILYVDFTESMTGDTYIEQIARTKDLAESDLNYYGLCMFGGKQQIHAITSRFSLWR